MTNDTESRFVGDTKTVVEFANRLLEACKKADEDGEAQNVGAVLEQSQANGPWRIIVHIKPMYL